MPLVVPVAGLMTTGYLISQFSAGAYARAGLLLLLGLVLFALNPRTPPAGRLSGS